MNMITNRRSAAFTSKKPGKTRQFNFFDVNAPGADSKRPRAKKCRLNGFDRRSRGKLKARLLHQSHTKSLSSFSSTCEVSGNKANASTHMA